VHYREASAKTANPTLAQVESASSGRSGAQRRRLGCGHERRAWLTVEDVARSIQRIGGHFPLSLQDRLSETAPSPISSICWVRAHVRPDRRKQDSAMATDVNWDQLRKALRLEMIDGDDAGSDAARRALEMILGEVTLRESVDYYVAVRPAQELVRSVLC